MSNLARGFRRSPYSSSSSTCCLISLDDSLASLPSTSRAQSLTDAPEPDLLSFLVAVTVLSLTPKTSSTPPSFSPWRRRDAEVTSARPNRANSTARRMDDLPEPMSPSNRLTPSPNSMVASSYDRMFQRRRDINLIGPCLPLPRSVVQVARGGLVPPWPGPSPARRAWPLPCLPAPPSPRSGAPRRG